MAKVALLRLSAGLFLSVVSLFAQADVFMCNGAGRFAGIDRFKSFELVRPHNTRVSIFKSDTDDVTLEIDEANSDGTHYLKLEVASNDGHIRSVKASKHDMVMYLDHTATSHDSVNCIPVPGT